MTQIELISKIKEELGNKGVVFSYVVTPKIYIHDNICVRIVYKNSCECLSSDNSNFILPYSILNDLSLMIILDGLKNSN